MMAWMHRQRTAFDALIRDREIFMRTDGDIRFLTVSARLQRRVLAGISIALSLWLVATIGMAIYQFATSGDRALLASQEARIKAKEARVKAYQNQFANEAERLDARQGQLENMFKDHFGENASAAEASNVAATQGTPKGSAESSATGSAKGSAKGSDSVRIEPADKSTPDLSAIDARQKIFAGKLMQVVEIRVARAETALRELGIDPAAMNDATREQANGQGGPFIPMARRAKRLQDPTLDILTEALNRMETFERALLALPLGSPAASMMMSSGYGYRHDPFTGAGAFHAGLDFKGPVGTQIFAASAGTVSFMGQQSGYGNVVEIDHGHGIVTRYAHLSGFDSTLGQSVTGGMQIARMGNTGRSTGPHLHFEVRINGSAVDPRRFLEAKDNVLKIKALAGQRVNSVSSTTRGAR